MTRTVTALFDHRPDAEAAKERLQQSRVEADHIRIHDKSMAGYDEGHRSTTRDPGMWGSIKNAFLPDEDRHTYEEGVRRGGTLLTADVDDDCVDEAVRILEEANTVDIDDRSNQWRQSGWDYTGDAGNRSAFGGFGSDKTTDRDTLGTTGEREEVIPIVEENLVVGKRDVARGGVRVRSYVTETPVSEQISLRNERVDVERRSVDQPLSAIDGDAFRERTIDVTATGEEAVVGKTARVVEEVVVSKTAEQHTETVSDTVRRTDVEIDRDTDVETTGGSTFGTDKDRRI